jgi:hypothetical protein
MNERKATDQDDTAQSETLERKTTPKKGNHGGALSRDVQVKIGQQIRAYYERLIEPPPDRFIELLRQLDKSGGKDPPNDN